MHCVTSGWWAGIPQVCRTCCATLLSGLLIRPCKDSRANAGENCCMGVRENVWGCTRECVRECTRECMGVQENVWGCTKGGWGECSSESVSECITRCIRNIKASEYISDTHRQAPHKYRTTDYSQQMRQTSDRCMTRQSSHNKPAQETQHS